MPSLLRIDSSPRGAGSHSKFVVDRVQKRLVINSPDIEICQRDLSSLEGIEDITVFRIEGTSVLNDESLAKQKFALQAQVRNSLGVN